MTEYVIRFLVGGAVVSAFAMLGDLLRPKSFAGLFGAAPSVALATLGIAVYQHGAGYAAVQTQAMMAGARCLPPPCPREVAGGDGYVAVLGRVADCRLRVADHYRRSDMSPIRFSASSLKEGRWYEYLIRFALGGAATVFTGLISSRYGAFIGGLFLALPAIFCASATLIEKHEIRRKREAGLSGERRGQRAAAVDSAGAALGAIGMLTFAIVFSLTVETSITAAFISASFAWLLISVAAWYVRRKTRSARRVRTEQGSGSAMRGRG